MTEISRIYNTDNNYHSKKRKCGKKLFNNTKVFCIVSAIFNVIVISCEMRQEYSFIVANEVTFVDVLTGGCETGRC